MMQLLPATTRTIQLLPAAQRGIEVEPVNSAQPSPAIRLLSGPPGTIPGPMGEISEAEAQAIAEEAATRERNDPLLLVESLLNAGL